MDDNEVLKSICEELNTLTKHYTFECNRVDDVKRRIQAQEELITEYVKKEFPHSRVCCNSIYDIDTHILTTSVSVYSN